MTELDKAQVACEYLDQIGDLSPEQVAVIEAIGLLSEGSGIDGFLEDIFGLSMEDVDSKCEAFQMAPMSVAIADRMSFELDNKGIAAFAKASKRASLISQETLKDYVVKTMTVYAEDETDYSVSDDIVKEATAAMLEAAKNVAIKTIKSRGLVNKELEKASTWVH